MSRPERTICLRCGATNHRPTEVYAQAVGCWSCGRRLPARSLQPRLEDWILLAGFVAAIAGCLYWLWS